MIFELDLVLCDLDGEKAVQLPIFLFLILNKSLVTNLELNFTSLKSTC